VFRFSFLVGPKTDLDILFVEDSFANVLVLIQETTERRVGTNVRA
jgi:hypothetical protein